MLKYLRYRELYFIALRSKLALLLKKKSHQQWFHQYKKLFRDKFGFEIGGPSRLFAEDIVPVYQLAEQIDGANFSNQTVWEGVITDEYQYFQNKKGKQYIAEATDLGQIDDKKYEFILSCHSLEHTANPLKAVEEWYRILKKDGVMLLVLPDKRFTFDRKRPFTSFHHILQDLQNNIGEDDSTHLSEILNLHDLSLDPGAGTDIEAFRKRSENNFGNRCLHHHVFNHELLKEIFLFFKMNTIAERFIPPVHQIIIGRK